MGKGTSLDFGYSAPGIELLDICTEECFALTAVVSFEDEDVTDDPGISADGWNGWL